MLGSIGFFYFLASEQNQFRFEQAHTVTYD